MENKEIKISMSDNFLAVKEKFKNELSDGAVCPCCKQYAKIYRRKLNSGMARGLLLMIESYVKTKKNLFQINNFFKSKNKISISGDISKFAYWDILKNVGDRLSGPYRITDKGFEFAYNKITVEALAIVYNGNLLRLDGDFVNIKQCLGKRFIYSEIVNSFPTVFTNQTNLNFKGGAKC